MEYKVIHYFMNENLTVVEIKKEGLPEDAPKDQIYFWLSILIETKKVERLEFQEMREETVDGRLMNVRVFSEGDLRFDDFFARSIINGNGQIMMNESKKDLPAEIQELVTSFISQS